MSKPKKTKRFRYPLETLLKVRDIRETQEKEKFQKKELKYKEEIKVEKELKDKKEEEVNELAEKMTGDLPDMQAIQLRNAHIDALKDKITDQIKVREEAEKERDDQRVVLVEAQRDKKIMEKDREKTRDGWKKMMDKEEGKFLDDIGTIGFERKKREK